MKYALLTFAAIAGAYAQNISTLSAEIQRAPSASLYAERAAAYLASGDARGALADTDRALDKDALNVRALVLRGQANSKLGRYSAAVTDLTGAIGLAPTDAALYAARAEAYAAVGDQPRALADKNEALRLDPTIIAVLDRKPAPAPEVAPVPPPAREPTVVTPPPAAPKAQPAKAPPATAPAVVATAAPPVAAAPPVTPTDASADAHYQRAKALINDKKYAEAVTAMNEAIKAQPKNAIYFNTRGYARYLAKDAKGAVQDYDEAIKINPDYLNATHNRSVARRAAGDIAGADADKKREAELTPKP